MSLFINIKKFKNTFLTPYHRYYYIQVDERIKKSKEKSNKFIKIFYKYLSKLFWFFPTLESHRYWNVSQEKDKHGYEKYLDMDDSAKILIDEISKRTNKEDKVLDLCCNVGRHLNALNKIGYSNLYGVDINNLAIQKMKTIYKNLNSANISYKSAESYLINTEDNFFDLIYTHGATVELIPPTFPIIDEVCRVTKNYAIFLIQENGHAYPRFWRYEFKKNKMDLIYYKDCSGLSLLVYKKNNRNGK